MSTLRFDPKAQITMAGLQQSASRFFAWWGECLWEAAPPSWRRRLAQAFGHWTVRLTGGAWSMRSPSSEHDDLVLDPAMSDAELRERVAQVAPASRERRVDVVFPAELAMVRQIRLPAAARNRLHSVVGLQLGRLSPFRTEDLQFDCRVADAGQSDEEIVAEVAMVPARALKDVERDLARLGLDARWLTAEGLPFRFSPMRQQRTTTENLNRILASAAVAICVLAFILAPMVRGAETDGLTADVAALRAPARQALGLAADLRRVEAPVIAANAVLAKPDALDVLERLTAVLPADVQLSALKVDGARVHLSGTCSDARKLVALLRGADGFSRVASGGGKMADGRDGFDIEMTVRAVASREAR